MTLWLRSADTSHIVTSALEVSFSELFYDYIIYFPGDETRYVVRVGDIKLGMGPKYLLSRLIDEVKQIYPETIPASDMDVRTLPQLEEPILRRLGLNLIVKQHRNPAEEKVDKAHAEAFNVAVVDAEEVTTGGEQTRTVLNEHGKIL